MKLIKVLSNGHLDGNLEVQSVQKKTKNKATFVHASNCSLNWFMESAGIKVRQNQTNLDSKVWCFLSDYIVIWIIPVAASTNTLINCRSWTSNRTKSKSLKPWMQEQIRVTHSSDFCWWCSCDGIPFAVHVKAWFWRVMTALSSHFWSKREHLNVDRRNLYLSKIIVLLIFSFLLHVDLELWTTHLHKVHSTPMSRQTNLVHKELCPLPPWYCEAQGCEICLWSCLRAGDYGGFGLRPPVLYVWILTDGFRVVKRDAK